MTKGPCMCGSPDCPSCGGAQGTYRQPLSMEDMFAALTAVTVELEHASAGVLDPFKARSAIQWARSIIDEFELCEACELRPAEPGESLCEQCAERASEAASSQSECFRGSEAESFEAEQMDKIQRELKR